MSDTRAINSEEYWDDRFATDWESRGGRTQSIFFTQVALEYCPQWLLAQIEAQRLSICDWGCAMGDGTAAWASRFPHSLVTGIDFSQKAVEAARAAYRNVTFESPSLEESGVCYDVLFSSNTLEHLEDAKGALGVLAAHCRKYLVLLLPFQEYDRMEEHLQTFDFANLDAVLGDRFVLAHCAAFDVSMRENTRWLGKQVLLVYADRSLLTEDFAREIGQTTPDSPTFVAPTLDAACQRIAAGFLSLGAAGVEAQRLQDEWVRREQEFKAATAAQAERLAHIRQALALQREALQAQLHQRDQECKQIEDGLLAARRELADQQRTFETRIDQQAQAFMQTEERLRGLQTELQQSAEWNQHLRERTATLDQWLADIRISRRYKFGNILSAFKRRPAGSFGVLLKWAVGGYARQDQGLAGALQAPDPLLTVQQALVSGPRPRANLPAAPAVAAPGPAAAPLPDIGSSVSVESQPVAVTGAIACLVQDFLDGGLERVVIDLCMSLRQPDRPVQILVAGKSGRCAVEARKLGIHVVELTGDDQDIDRQIAELSPRLVLTHHCYGPLDILHGKGISVIEVLHNAYYWHEDDDAVRRARTQTVDGYIAVSTFVAEFCATKLRIPRDKIDVVPNGLNAVGLIRPPLGLLAERRRQKTAWPTLIHVSSISPQKAPLLAVSAMALLVKDFPDARLLMCGSSNHHPDLAETVLENIASRGLKDNVIWKGPVDRRSLSRLLAEAHVGILPSLFEGFSIASLEYAYFALPSILSQTGAAKELLDEYGHGLIVPDCALEPRELTLANVKAKCWGDCQKTAARVAERMSALLGDYEKYLAAAVSCAQRCDEYSIDATARKYAQVIERYL
jgi:glycosyltransferase involved in cell wall biosynthesis